MNTAKAKPILQPRDLLGIPFLMGGRDPRFGLDCWGVVLLMFRRYAKIELPDPIDPPPDPRGDARLLEYDKWFHELPISAPLFPLDLLYLRKPKETFPSHVVCMCSENYCIESIDPVGVVMTSIYRKKGIVRRLRLNTFIDWTSLLSEVDRKSMYTQRRRRLSRGII